MLAVADLGRFLAQRGLREGNKTDVADGETLLGRALGLDQNCATAHAGLGEVALKRGDRGGAQKHLDRAAAADPNAAAVRRLGELIRDKKGRRSSGVHM